MRGRGIQIRQPSHIRKERTPKRIPFSKGQAVHISRGAFAGGIGRIVKVGRDRSTVQVSERKAIEVTRTVKVHDSNGSGREPIVVGASAIRSRIYGVDNRDLIARAPPKGRQQRKGKD